jgi:hypothetical protein
MTLNDANPFRVSTSKRVGIDAIKTPLGLFNCPHLIGKRECQKADSVHTPAHPQALNFQHHADTCHPLLFSTSMDGWWIELFTHMTRKGRILRAQSIARPATIFRNRSRCWLPDGQPPWPMAWIRRPDGDAILPLVYFGREGHPNGHLALPDEQAPSRIAVPASGIPRSLKLLLNGRVFTRASLLTGLAPILRIGFRCWLLAGRRLRFATFQLRSFANS